MGTNARLIVTNIESDITLRLATVWLQDKLTSQSTQYYIATVY